MKSVCPADKHSRTFPPSSFLLKKENPKKRKNRKTVKKKIARKNKNKKRGIEIKIFFVKPNRFNKENQKRLLIRLRA